MKTITIRVWGSNTYKRTYFNTVSINGANLIAPWGKSGSNYNDVEIEQVSGGYTSGDGDHAWTAEYVLKVTCPDDAEPKIRGRQINGSSGFVIL